MSMSRICFSWVHLDYDGYMNLLAAGANPEFNNPGGLLSPVVDFGVLGGLAYWGSHGPGDGLSIQLVHEQASVGHVYVPSRLLNAYRSSAISLLGRRTRLSCFGLSPVERVSHASFRHAL